MNIELKVNGKVIELSEETIDNIKKEVKEEQLFEYKVGQVWRVYYREGYYYDYLLTRIAPLNNEGYGLYSGVCMMRSGSYVSDSTQKKLEDVMPAIMDVWRNANYSPRLKYLGKFSGFDYD